MRESAAICRPSTPLTSPSSFASAEAEPEPEAEPEEEIDMSGGDMFGGDDY